MATVHDLRHLSAEDAYDETQSDDSIKDGDVLNLGGGKIAIMYFAWPTMVRGSAEGFHTLQGDWLTLEGGRYAESYRAALEVAA